ncbi:GntR family transcriptional regulator [Jeotgalibaca sp. A122]|uniref:GntR family transcriptional regulator n=1 Tax=Jeotgalibaca sp. A122 TaxID=3457322 RepID=UPI003FD5019A
MLDKNSPHPLYSQLIDGLMAEIEKNYQPDEKIMSEREICQTFDVSRTTVRQALAEMENLGYIYKKHGKGTFVSKRSQDQKNLAEAYSFTESMKAINKTPRTIIASFEEISANKHIQDTMQTTNETVFRLIRIRLADDEPMMYEVSYLPVDIFAGLTLEKIQGKPLYDVFKEDYRVTIRYAEEEFSAGIVREVEAENLGVSEDSPCLRIKRLTYNDQGEIIEYTLSAARADQFIYKISHKHDRN